MENKKPRKFQIINANNYAQEIEEIIYEQQWQTPVTFAIEYSAFEALQKQNEILTQALEFNKKEWEAVNPDGFKHMTAWQKTRDALTADGGK